MADKSNIEWTDATWNPIVGCSVLSPGCTNCYAMKTAARMNANPATPHYHGTVKESKAGPVWTGKVAQASEETLTAPLRWKKPRRIFVNSMGDLFHESIPDEWIDRVFAVMGVCTHHTFQVLTKRASRMREYCASDATMGRVLSLTNRMMGDHGHSTTRHIPDGLPGFVLPNVWLGVSCERQEEADDRIPELLNTPAAVRFVSAEPLLGPIDLRHNWQPEGICIDWLSGKNGTDPEIPKLDWIIVGGESGSKARPMHPDWARSIRQQCDAAGVAFFFKQWGEWGPLDHSDAADEAGWQGRGDWMILSRDGDVDVPDHRWPDEEQGEVAIVRVGKKRAGRLLDGREHNAFPVIEGDQVQRGLSSPESKQTEDATA